MATPRTAGPPRPSVFERLAAWSYRRRWLALLTWVVVLAGVTVTSQLVGADYRNDFSLPGTESQRVIDTLGDDDAGGTLQVVVQAPDGVRDATVRERVEAMLDDVRGLPHVADVRAPYDDPSAVSKDGTLAYATVTLDVQSEHMPLADTERVIEVAQQAERDGLRVEVGGDAARAAQGGEGGAAEGLGMLAALVVMVFLFGSLLAASLPLIIAVFAVASTVGLIVLASHAFTIADFTPPVMMLVGLGVGIDYALLVFARFRHELLRGADRAGAARIALDTAGRTVFFAGCTVIIALVGLVALGLGSLQGVAMAVALTVLVTMLASLTLLPALLALIGGRVERTVHKRAAKARSPEGERWRRWSNVVGRHPWTATLLAVAALLALAAPTLHTRLGFADAGNDAETKTSRQAYDLLAEGFGPGFNGPLVVVSQGDRDAALALRRSLVDTDGVAGATEPFSAGARRVYTVIAFPTTSPQDEDTARLVRHLRSDVLPDLERAHDATYLVGGGTAASEDFADAVAGRLPIFVGIVVGLSALLLMVVFRSLLIPLKAALLNLLSVGAAIGAITLVFQEGWFGVPAGPVEAFVPVMIFAIAFGLSMDYEVFLLSRMHEEWERHRDAGRAVREGLATTGRVVTAAALIMMVVFGAFLLSPDRMLQQFGLGLAVAIGVDALVIRCLVVPAVMRLFGEHAWWVPSWLARLLPRVALEKHTSDDAVVEPVGSRR